MARVAHDKCNSGLSIVDWIHLNVVYRLINSKNSLRTLITWLISCCTYPQPFANEQLSLIGIGSNLPIISHANL